uniref:Uncharacterized protein n=1 Tax=Oryctolagus cuniculus TaxID=9986 RepID=A0A5F9DRG8_RABIT
MAAVVASARWLGVRSGLGLPLSGRRVALCEKAPGCRLYSGSATLSKIEETDTTGIEEVVIPKKKIWDKVAVLQALASTVNRDPTAVPYSFQDDPYLIPTSSLEGRSFLLAKKSGESSAKFIINSYPKYFQKDIAEPHIQEPLCLLKQVIVFWIYYVIMVTKNPQLIFIFNKENSQKNWKRLQTKMLRSLGRSLELFGE